jgi:hypothetical protein
MSSVAQAGLFRRTPSKPLRGGLLILYRARLHLSNGSGSRRYGWDNGDKVAWLILYEKFSDLVREGS